MRIMGIILILMGIFIAESSPAEMKGGTYYLPAVDTTAEKNQAIANKDLPLKYAVNTAVKDIYHNKGNSQGGKWTEMFDGSWQFTLRLAAKNATSINVGMEAFFLPPSAELWVSTDDQSIMRGPYDGSYNQKHGYFWVGDVPADHLNMKISVSPEEKQFLSFKITNITRGFFKYWEEPSYRNKSGSCNIDVACPEGDEWQSQINSVARYTFTHPTLGGRLCSGQLINNTAQNSRAYFLTGDHCGYSAESGQQYTLSQRENTAASMAFIWSYQSLTCRAPGSAQSGLNISTSGFNQRQSGATYIASNPDSDFALVELNQLPDPIYGVEYTGWDRRNIAPDSAVTIHHPGGFAKRISIEDDPVFVSSYFGTVGLGDRTHLRVNDWDLGTTEAGSSGSGLWNSDQLLVGTLHGGDAACGNDEPDWYGRFFTSWSNGNNPQSRLSDWLDPLNTGQLTLEGAGGCDAPVVTVINDSSNSVGDLLTFSAEVSGGAGGYTYQWDINADGGIDGKGAEIEARYNQQFVGNIELIVTDSIGCRGRASQPVVITGADVQLQQVDNIRLGMSQVCGNGNAVVDPGERWTAQLMARNNGAKTANNAYLALAKTRNNGANDVSDSYGNSVSSCERLFIDITETGTLKEWQAAGEQYSADDEGSTLIQLNQAFDHYGQSISQISASTNGYFSTSPTSTGDDWSNDCPLPEPPSTDDEGARIAPMHADLKESKFYHQSFAVCPRQAETGVDLACEVFTWQAADFWSTNNFTEMIDIQAILYPATSQWVYQYAGTDFDGTNSTTGMQNSAANDGLTYACESANSINSNEAVCTFNKNNQPGSGSDYLMLENPVISLGDLLVNESQSANLNFAISEDATCGSVFDINHQAAVYDTGFNAGKNSILTHTVGVNNQCNVVTNCGVGTAGESHNDIVPRRGLWWNPDRDGNGFDLYTIGADRLVYYFYTGDKNGEPVWYLANDADASHNQYFNNITYNQAPGGFGNGDLELSIVGWSNTTFIDDSTAIQVREINGVLSAEKQFFFQYGPNNTPDMHTGSYYNPNDSGWGHSIGTLGNARVAITYIYDQTGKPYWTIGSGPNDDSAFSVVYSNSFCPSCPAVAADNRVVGEIKLTLDGQVSGTLDRYEINDEGVSWNETNVPVVNLIPPNN